jgi:hypothetical protein
MLHLHKKPQKKHAMNYKYHHVKNRFFSANIGKKRLIKKEKNNNIEKEIYLNDYINTSSEEINNKRLQSSKGFLRKIDYELNNILLNQINQNNKKCMTVETQNFHDNEYDITFHDNYNKFGYYSCNKKDRSNNKKLFNNDNSEQKNYFVNQYINEQLKKKHNSFLSMMNSITRKVEFLNTKNHLLSDENTMNLLINEEEFLNDKLNNILRDNYTIKKFSKSIYDENNGNKYLLPLFNNTDKIFLTSQNQNNRAKIKQTKEYYNKCFSIDDLMERNKSKDYNKKIIRIFSKKKINGKEKKKLKITYFPSNPESTVPEVENYKRITLSYDKKNIIINVFQ